MNYNEFQKPISRVKFSIFEIAFFESLLVSYFRRYTEEERGVYDVSILSIFFYLNQFSSYTVQFLIAQRRAQFRLSY